MKRLLCVLSGMNAGGAETFLMKIYRKLDKTEYQMDFCINEKEKCFYEDEITSLGGRFFRIPTKSENVKEFKKQLFSVVKDNGYEYVLRISSNCAGFLDLKIAKKAGAKVCAARSSNSSDGGGIKMRFLNFLGRLFYLKYVDVKIAPSDLAGIYSFGKRAYRKGDIRILRNALDLDVYKFDKSARVRIREEFGIKDGEYLFGHVGRFNKQKNHIYLLNVFAKIKGKMSNAKLMLVGGGPLENEIKEKAKSLHIYDDIIFTGIRQDVPQLLSAMDTFLFPSFYEGMPNTVIEAEATGLPCVISDKITREADITGLVEYLSIDEKSLDMWANLAIEKCKTERKDTKKAFIENGYEINNLMNECIREVFCA